MVKIMLPMRSYLKQFEISTKKALCFFHKVNTTGCKPLAKTSKETDTEIMALYCADYL